MDAHEIEAVWQAWEAGHSRCPYCIDKCQYEWASICDCRMAPALDAVQPCPPGACEDCDGYRRFEAEMLAMPPDPFDGVVEF